MSGGYICLRGLDIRKLYNERDDFLSTYLIIKMRNTSFILKMVVVLIMREKMLGSK